MIEVFQYEKEEVPFKYKKKNRYPGYSDFAQTFDELKIVHIAEGSGIWNINGKDYEVSKGDIIIFSRLDERHLKRVTSETALVTEQIEFLPMTIYPMQNCADFFFDRPENFSNILTRDNENYDYIIKCFGNMRKEFKENKRYQKEYIVHLLTGMILAAARIFDSTYKKENVKNGGNYSVVSKVMLYIKNHLDEDLSRETLSKKHGISQSYLSRLFKEYSGIQLQEYIVRCRVQKAIILLKSGKYNVLEAALESGFSSSSGFYSAFNKIMGKKPKDVIKIDN